MQYLDKAGLAKLFRTARDRNPEYHLVMLTQFFTGARISQIVGEHGLRGEDIFEMNGQLVIKIRSAKRGHDGYKTLHVDVDPAFDMTPLIELAAQRRTALLFGGVDRCNLNKAMRKYCVAAGIHSDFGHTHMLRHSAAMIIWDATQRVGAISQFLQHRSPGTAMFYLAENDGKTAQAAMDNLQFTEAA